MNNETIKKATQALKPVTNILKKIRPEKGQRIILMYHGISKRPNFNCVTAALFKEQLAWLTENYIVVPLSVLIQHFSLPDIANPETRLVAITFDDGYCNFVDLALPVLQEYKCHATVFVPTGKVGLYNDWDEKHHKFYKMTIMTYETLRQLPEEFVEIGSHGITHLAFDNLTPTMVTKELIESRLELEQNTARPVPFFAFPFGVRPAGNKVGLYDQNNRMYGGYRAACTTWWGRYNSASSIDKLRRIGIWDCDSMRDFIDKLHGCYDWLETKEKIGRSIKFIQSYFP